MLTKSKEFVSKPDLSWLEISALVFVMEHLKDHKLTKLGLNSDKVIAARKAQRKMAESLEEYIANGK